MTTARGQISEKEQCVFWRHLGGDLKLIHLTRGQVAVVDSADFDWLNQWKWSAHFAPCTRTFYAVRNAKKVNGKRGNIWMHREIMGCVKGETEN